MDEQENKKTKTIRARVTLEQKLLFLKKVEEAGYETESEYVLACCLKGELEPQSPFKLSRLKHSDGKIIRIRVTPDEKNMIFEKYRQSGINNFGRYVRICCLGKEIVVIDSLKDFLKELNKIGNNLNQLTMLCHQGLIQTPDITETMDYLKKLYEELVKINKRIKPGR